MQMSTWMRVFCVLGIIGVLAGGCSKKENPNPQADPGSANLTINKIAGMWKIDPERSLAEGKKSPKYEPGKDEAMLKLLGVLAGQMNLKISDQAISYVNGEQELPAPIVSVTEAEDGLTVQVTKGDEKVQLRFTLLDDTFMNFKSSKTDDMDYLIWKRME